MGIDITQLLTDYNQEEPKRSTGGIHAMSGFAFQAQVYVAELVEALIGSDPHKQGQIFVEALSDIAKWDDEHGMILLQAKRTLKPATLDDAAAEIAVIEAFVAAKYPALAGTFKYGVVSFLNPDEKNWSNLPKNSPHTALIQGLEAAGRLMDPRVERDPAWRMIAALWRQVANPYEFARYAFERALLRAPGAADAQACRNDIAERFVALRSVIAGVGQILAARDFSLEPQQREFHLEAGRPATLSRMRAGQYMPRDQRVEALARSASDLSALALSSPGEAVNTLWLSGRSGAGKSVLLLQLLEKLVADGRRVLWLGSDAGSLDRALRNLDKVLPEQAPEFIAVDDLYDRDAREQLELSKLASYIDEQGHRSWPVVLTCGPSEFAEAFDEARGFLGFNVTQEQIGLLDQSEACEFLSWASARRNVNQQGEAFEQARQGEGLFVSMASELEFGTLKEFGARFNARLAALSLQKPLRPLLALNRLYLKAPHRWLSASDREKLELLNRNGDFSLLEFQPGSTLVRLTHPHLSDAIYKVLLKPPAPLAYANDLATAFELAVNDSDYALAARLLRTFSATDSSLIHDRLKDVNLDELAKRCVLSWQIVGAKSERRVQLDVAISWACWPEAYASLGLGKDALIDAALGALDQWQQTDRSPGSWLASWWRLWRTHPTHPALARWALKQIASEEGMQLHQWSRIWEELAGQPAAQAELKPELASVAVSWLARDFQRTDWHFVWKKLKAESVASHADTRRLGLALLAVLSAPRWPFVFNDMLALLADPSDAADARKVVAYGCSWLNGRERMNDWPFVWQALIKRRELLPPAFDERTMVVLGSTWLLNSEERPAWSIVWDGLLARSALLPDELPEHALIARGRTWLVSGEDLIGWSYTWCTLMERARLYNEVANENALVIQGCSWVIGREDCAGWSHVWQALLERPTSLPEASRERTLVIQGVEWLSGREDSATWGRVWEIALEWAVLRKEGAVERTLVAQGFAWLRGREDVSAWAYVWGTLLKRTAFMVAPFDEHDLVAQGCAWLTGRIDRAEWAPVLQGVLSKRALLSAEASAHLQFQLEALWKRLSKLSHGARGHTLESLLDAGITDDSVLQAVLVWLQGDQSHPAWILIAGKFLLLIPDAGRHQAIVQDVIAIIQRHPNAGTCYKLQTLYEAHAVAGTCEIRDVILTALRQRKSSPAWAMVRTKLEIGESISAIVTKQDRLGVTVELEGGLFAIIGDDDGFLYPPGSRLKVIVKKIVLEFERIIVMPDRREQVSMLKMKLIPGQVYEGTVTGHLAYGIFVQVHGQKGLLRSRHMKNVQPHPDLLPKGSKLQVRLLEIGSKGLELALD